MIIKLTKAVFVKIVAFIIFIILVERNEANTLLRLSSFKNNKVCEKSLKNDKSIYNTKLYFLPKSRSLA